MFHGMLLFDFAEMDRLKNNSMTASSRSTALAIVADLLRRVNVGVPSIRMAEKFEFKCNT